MASDASLLQDLVTARSLDLYSHHSTSALVPTLVTELLLQDNMESAFQVRASRSVQQRPKSAGAIRRPVTSLSEMRSQKQDSIHRCLVEFVCRRMKFDLHAAKGGKHMQARCRRWPKSENVQRRNCVEPRNRSVRLPLASLHAETTPLQLRPRNRRNPTDRPSVRDRNAPVVTQCIGAGPPAAADRPGAGLQRPKSAGVSRRTPRPASEPSESGLSRREQIALKKQQDASRDLRHKKSPRPVVRLV